MINKLIMRVLCFFAVLTLFSVSLQAQFYEDFSSFSFLDKQWQGDTSQFAFSNSTAIPLDMKPGLQLNDSIANTSMLVAPYTIDLSDEVEWSFWIKLSFNTTKTNHARVYIMSDLAELKDSVNGYFIGIGEDDKRITLCKQSGAVTQNIITGEVAYLSKTTNEVRVKVIRDIEGNWNLYSDTLGGINWTLEGTAKDNTFSQSNWHGLYCKYTKSNSTKIYFDEFYAGQVQVDTIKPFVEKIHVISQSQLDIVFSELVTDETATDVQNYFAHNGIGNPFSIATDVFNPFLYHLSFETPFAENSISTITIKNIVDFADNIIDDTDIDFAYFEPQQFDVLINEIMANPTPVVGLPEYEYVELYNMSPFPVNLSNWTISFGSTVRTFADVTIPNKSHLIVCGNSAVSALEEYGNIYAFSSISISNSGQTISLADNNNKIIHSVSFTDAWYQSNVKKNGGWSLELIDPLNPCAGSSNWKASNNKLGGTPGFENSVYGNNPDIIAPELYRVSVISDSQIELWFTESMDYNSMLKSSAYSFSNGLELSTEPIPVAPAYTSVILNYTPAIKEDVVYRLTISDTVSDCTGNILSIGASIEFALSKQIEANDIVINEILSNPPAGLSEFIEIYNRSDKILDVKELNIANIDKKTGDITSERPIDADGFLLFPEDYLIISKNSQAIIDYYYCPYPKRFIQLLSLPTYNNDNGSVVLILNDGTIIDRVDYDVSMHLPLLLSTKGVSLERVNFNRPSADKTNWHSASENVGFATPGYKNSQFSDVQFDGDVLLYPDIFSPDNDGYNDVLHISYEFPTPGFIGTITIYDAHGRLIRNLVSSELLGTSGVYTWDGISNHNQKAEMGIYVILLEVFDLNGVKKVYKNTSVLAGKLK